MLGFKIFDRDEDALLNELFELSLTDNLALEIALYNDNAEDFTNRVIKNPLYINNPNKSIHLNYLKYVVNNIKEEKHFNNFMVELEQAKKLLLNRGVIHYQHAHNTKTHLENLTIQALVQNLTLLHNVAKEHDFTFYIENTYIHQRKYFMNNLPNHKIIWDTVMDLGFHDKIGICLDWGHVKAFGDDSLDDWLGYVKFLKSYGMPIYMHVHDNNSVKDLHASLKEGYEQDFHQHNHEKDLPFIEMLKNTHEHFKNDSLILEYNSKIAAEHYYWTKEQI
jgi:endonuclease IV